MALGETLRGAREARRISLNQAALETRIRQAVLEALEDGDFTGVPPRPFLRGLLRNYALYLHLDADSVLDEYDYETGHKPAIARTPPPEPEPQVTEPPPTIIVPAQPYPSAPPAQPPEEPSTFPPFQIPTAPRMTGDADVAGPTALPPAPETVYQVAPEIEAVPPEPTAPLNLSQEPPSLARRIGSTRIPEAVAIFSIGVALFILVSVGFTAFQNFAVPFATAPTQQPTRVPTATVPRGSTPTRIPTLLQTAGAQTPISSVITTTRQAETETVAATTAHATGTPTFDVPADAQMTLEVQANGEMGVWVVVDGDTVFNGTFTNESRTFIARARLFVQIKNVENGRVFFQGTRILPRNQQERTELYRAWFMNPLGTPVIVPPTPFPVPVEPTAPATLTSVPSETPTPTLTRTPTTTRTRTLTATRTPSTTTTPSATASRTATPSRTPSLTQTVTRTPTAAATATRTRTATTRPSATRTASPSRTRTPTAGVTRTATRRATADATITQAVPPLPSASRSATVTRTRTRTRTAIPIRTVTGTPGPSRTLTP